MNLTSSDLNKFFQEVIHNFTLQIPEMVNITLKQDSG